MGTHKDSVFGYGFLPGMLALVVWSIGTSVVNPHLGTKLFVPKPLPGLVNGRSSSSDWFAGLRQKLTLLSARAESSCI